ncbi:MAG: elongation factor P [Candidatus Moranbacteria bacterium]|jgi:elongation factor P|nr:elongation factor P [Candidatus Moranbacteria bacterium]MDD5652223.1 elongation factor P [Candidatus Moranbacteria bacterium]MDX9855327.1 elongation factor P [Candidatus Moranbacteria bacterium]
MFHVSCFVIGISDIKSGKYIVLNGEPYKVLSINQSAIGRGGSVLRTRLQNLATGAILDKTFQGAEKVEEADIEKTHAQYLYKENEGFSFMDSKSYEQFSIAKEMIGDMSDYMVEGTEVTIINFNGNPITVELPVKVKLKVIDAPPGVKGDTASGGDKLVTVETGAKITTPLFVDKGDTIIVNTEKGEYVSRA